MLFKKPYITANFLYDDNDFEKCYIEILRNSKKGNVL